MRAVQRLADIDVAEPGNDALIRQRGLQRGLLAVAGLRQHRGVERIAERLRPERTHHRFAASSVVARDQLHEAEAARIVERDDRAVRHVEHDVIVRRELAARVMEFAGRPLVARRAARGTSPTCRDASAAPRRTTDRRADIWRAGQARSTVAPSSRLLKFFGNGKRRSGRRCSTRTKRAPSITGCSPRRTVSTSGSSGMVSSVHEMNRTHALLPAPRHPPLMTSCSRSSRGDCPPQSRAHAG